MVNEELDREVTETFSFRMSKALRERLRTAAANHRRTVGREIVLRLIASFEMDEPNDDEDVVASSVAKEALAKAIAAEARIESLEARLANLEKCVQCR